MKNNIKVVAGYHEWVLLVGGEFVYSFGDLSDYFNEYSDILEVEWLVDVAMEEIGDKRVTPEELKAALMPVYNYYVGMSKALLNVA